MQLLEIFIEITIFFILPACPEIGKPAVDGFCLPLGHIRNLSPVYGVRRERLAPDSAGS
jgi:hypothetical protein